MDSLFEERTDMAKLRDAIDGVRRGIGQVIVGQQEMIDFLIAAILADGHVLVEGVPGVAKTLSAKLLAQTLDVPFSRIQFTPDLMPGDVLGTSVFNPRDMAFEFKAGPIFSNIILIDEINRAPAKTQAALFEVMEERQVTIDGHTYAMEPPFMVVATQNPVEQEGTYRLPEAQLDRFLFKINMGYPTQQEEVRILQSQQFSTASKLLANVSSVLNAASIATYRHMVRQIVADDKLLEFIAAIVGATRNNPALFLGASPRASLAILQAAKAMSAIRGRDFVLPEDILYVSIPVLRHRIVLSPEKEMEGLTPDELIRSMIEKIEVPR